MMNRRDKFSVTDQQYLGYVISEMQIFEPYVYQRSGWLPNFVWHGEKSSVIKSEGEEFAEQLTTVLYEHYYCQSGKYPDVRRIQKDLLLPLRRANSSILNPACKDAWAGCDHTLRQSNRESINGRYWEDYTSQPAFYYAIGDFAMNPDDEIGNSRIYLNIDPAFSSQWMKLVTSHLNFYQIPFQFKTLRYYQAYCRIDTSVIYLPRRYAEFCISLLSELGQKNKGLREEAPPFTFKVSSGIALADNPLGRDSFGMSRMRLVARGLVQAWQIYKAASHDRVLNCLREAYIQAGVSPSKPWLNTNNADYDIGNYPSRLLSHRPRVAKHQWINAADRIGGILLRDAIWSKDMCTWVGWDILPDTEGSRNGLSTVGGDMYSGTAGIALFFARLFQETKDNNYKRIAAGALNHALLKYENPTKRLAAYSGLSGVIYCAMECTRSGIKSFSSKTLNKRIADLLRHNFTDAENDIIRGRAGLIGILLYLYKNYPVSPERFLQKARKLGFELIKLAEKDGDKWSWKTLEAFNSKNLTGYSHGTSGIAAAFWHLYQVTLEWPFLNAMHNALAYEIGHFHHKVGNWQDFRDRELIDHTPSDNAPQYMLAWCSGAPGTSLVFADILSSLEHEGYKKILSHSIKTIKASLDPEAAKKAQNFCLCHGIFGNAEILMEIERFQCSKSSDKAVLAVAEAGLQTFDHNCAWPCGVHEAGQTPGLMMGLAGIGYFYLRLHNQLIPSVLYI